MAPRNRDTDDDAPWLAEAVPTRSSTRVSRRSFFWTIFIVLALATIAAVGLMMLMAKKDGGSTQGYMNAEQAPVITAEAGPYKIAPADPAGMKIDGLDGTMYTAGEGIDQGSNIDPSLAAEAPLPRPGASTAEPATAPAAGPPRELIPEGIVQPIPPAAAPTRVVPAVVTSPVIAKAPPVTLKPTPPVAEATPMPTSKPAPAKPTPTPLVVLPKPAAKAGTVQLGAFSGEDKANAAWATLSSKHGLSGKWITEVQSGGKTLYRLRASSADPAAMCARIKAAGDACAAVE